MRFCCKPPSWRSSTLIFISHQEEKKNAKGNRSSTSMETANQAKRRAGGTDIKGLRDGGMEWKSKTDLMFPCLVCHGTLGAPDPTPAIFLCPSPSPCSHACFCFACPVAGCGIPAQWAPYNWVPCLLFSPLPPTSSPFHFFPPSDILQ